MDPTITYKYTPYETYEYSSNTKPKATFKSEQDGPTVTIGTTHNPNENVITYANMPHYTHEIRSPKPKRKVSKMFIWIPILIILLISFLVTYFSYKKMTPLLPFCFGYTLSSVLAMVYFGTFYMFSR